MKYNKSRINHRNPSVIPVFKISEKVRDVSNSFGDFFNNMRGFLQKFLGFG